MPNKVVPYVIQVLATHINKVKKNSYDNNKSNLIVI